MRRSTFLRGEPALPGALPDVSWFNAEGRPFDWSQNDHSLVCLLGAPKANNSAGHNVLLICHGGMSPRNFVLPPTVRDMPWRLFLDTSAASPKDIFPNSDGPPPPAASSR